VHFGENVHVAEVVQRIIVSVGERAAFKGFPAASVRAPRARVAGPLIAGGSGPAGPSDGKAAGAGGPGVRKRRIHRCSTS